MRQVIRCYWKKRAESRPGTSPPSHVELAWVRSWVGACGCGCTCTAQGAPQGLLGRHIHDIPSDPRPIGAAPSGTPHTGRQDAQAGRHSKSRRAQRRSASSARPAPYLRPVADAPLSSALDQADAAAFPQRNHCCCCCCITRPSPTTRSTPAPAAPRY